MTDSMTDLICAAVRLGREHVDSFLALHNKPELTDAQLDAIWCRVAHAYVCGHDHAAKTSGQELPADERAKRLLHEALNCVAESAHYEQSSKIRHAMDDLATRIEAAIGCKRPEIYALSTTRDPL